MFFFGSKALFQPAMKKKNYPMVKSLECGGIIAKAQALHQTQLPDLPPQLMLIPSTEFTPTNSPAVNISSPKATV